MVPTYQAGGIQQNMGFVVSGVVRPGTSTSADGVYLVARDEASSPAYFLNVPSGQWAGWCDPPSPSAPADRAGCGSLPTINQAANTYPTYTFSPNTSSTGAAQLLKDPLWYVAKYGGYVKLDDTNTSGSGVGPTVRTEWDKDAVNTPGYDVPDNYFLVQNPLNLRTSLRRALENISNNSASGGNIIANSTQLGTDTYVFQATFNNNRWSGNLLAYAANTAGVSEVPAWNAADNVKKIKSAAEDTRKIFYWSDNSGGNKGDTFTWANLSTAERALFGADATSQEAVVKYIRGWDVDEFARGGKLRDRSASTVLGDISHSSPAYSKDSEVVFVGSNGGMLHAFSTKPVVSGGNTTPPGTELFAYIPSAVLPRLKNLASLGYDVAHEYFVDGDVAVSGKVSNRNYLVGTLGRGGKGLFGLDVTDPFNFSANDVKWEYFSNTDPHLGLMLGRPIIGTAENGTPIVILGNGYNSTLGSAALYVFNLTTGAMIGGAVAGTPLVAQVDAAGGNGLATPGVFDANNNGRIDTVYAGDLRGQVWRFDLSDTNPTNWGVSNGGLPIFTARSPDGARQPITAPMSVAVNSVSVDPNFNKRFVFFGTGSYFQSGDPATTQVQTLYSIVDDSATPHDQSSATATRAPLAPRIMTATEVVATRPDFSRPANNTDNIETTRTVRRLATASAGDMNGKLGCYVDLPQSGERVVTRANLFRLAEPTLIFSSILPETQDQCVPGGAGLVNAINPFTCGRLAKPFFDLNDNGKFDDDGVLSGGAYASSIELKVGMPGEAVIIGTRLVVGGSAGKVDDVRVNTGITPLRGRLSWREIVRD